ncbi:MAG: DMT family transporter [Acidobacteria bacterium]|nr:DMT family transporter [Acidobacteriota bacterium]
MEASVLVGQVASLAAALCWSVSVTLFRAPIAEHGARAVNLAKSLLATVLLGTTMLAAGQGRELIEAPRYALGLITVSALLGMTMGDTALFSAVHRVGVHRALLLQTLSPVFAAFFAFVLYGEHPSPGQLLGAVVVLAGVVLVVAPRRRDPRSPALTSSGAAAGPPPSRVSANAAGVAFGVLAAFGQGTGVVLAKAGMRDIPFLPASFLRLGVAALGLLALLGLSSRLGVARSVLAPAALRRLAAPTLIGTYLGILLMMAGIAFAPAALAAVLLSTSPVFSLFIDAKVSGAPITARGLLGTLLAVLGVAVLVFAGR